MKTYRDNENGAMLIVGAVDEIRARLQEHPAQQLQVRLQHQHEPYGPREVPLRRDLRAGDLPARKRMQHQHRLGAHGIERAPRSRSGVRR